MKLREFDIEWGDAPSRDAWAAFRDFARHIPCLYGMCFPGLRTENIWKVLVVCKENPASPSETVGGVVFVEVRFDASRFEKASVDEKKHILLAALHEGALAAATEWSLASEGFVVARDAVLARSILAEWIAARKSSPDRKRIAEVRALFEPNVFRCWLEVRDKSGKLTSPTLAFEEGPSEWLFVAKLGPLRWSSNHRVEFSARDGSVHCALELEE